LNSTTKVSCLGTERVPRGQQIGHLVGLERQGAGKCVEGVSIRSGSAALDVTDRVMAHAGRNQLGQLLLREAAGSAIALQEAPQRPGVAARRTRSSHAAAVAGICWVPVYAPALKIVNKKGNFRGKALWTPP
jgi:hypothetical protein